MKQREYKQWSAHSLTPEMTRLILALLLVLPVLATPAFADEKHAGHAAHSKKPAKRAYGQPGDPAKVTRTIEVGMNDAMRFTPADLTVKRGETIRFVVGNSGKIKHELMLGTMKELKEHAEKMKKHPAMDHGDEEENAVEVEPGKRGELVWQFTRAGKFSFGCLVPGHFEAGMVGRLTVQ